jgi:hypothetical protein
MSQGRTRQGDLGCASPELQETPGAVAVTTGLPDHKKPSRLAVAETPLGKMEPACPPTPFLSLFSC